MRPGHDQAGWYDDLEDASAQRYWDGNDWTPRRRRKSRPVSGTTPAKADRPPAPPPPPTPTPTPAYTIGNVAPPPPAVSGWPPPNIATDSQHPSRASARATGSWGSLTIRLLYGGLGFATLAVFMPFASVSVLDVEFANVSLPWKYKIVVLALIAGAAASAWPTALSTSVEEWRRLATSIMAGLMVLATGVAYTSVFKADSVAGRDVTDIVGISPGSGLVLFSLAEVSMIVAVIRLWIQPNTTSPP